MVGCGRVVRFSVAVLLGATLASSVAVAQVSDANRAAARDLGGQGIKAYQAGDYKVAIEKLEKAYVLVPAPSLRLWQARALVKLNKLLAASEQYLAATRIGLGGGDVSLQQRAQADAMQERDALLPRIPSILIQLEGAAPGDVTISVDGQPIASALVGEKLPADPGERVIAALRGTERVQTTVKLTEGQHQTAVLRFVERASAPPAVAANPPPSTTPEPKATGPLAHSPPTPTPVTAAPPVEATPLAPASGRSTTRTLGWVGVGVGGAGLALGAVTGAMLLGRKGELQDSASCHDYKCLPSKSSDVSSFNTLRTVSGVGLIAGGVLLGAGVGLLLVPVHEGADSSRTTLLLGPTGLSARGVF